MRGRVYRKAPRSARQLGSLDLTSPVNLFGVGVRKYTTSFLDYYVRYCFHLLSGYDPRKDCAA